MPITSIVPISPIVNIDVSSESKVILLPAASTCIGTTFTLRDSNGAASTNSIFVSTIGLDRVDGEFLYPLTSTLETLKVMSLGNTSWSLVQRTTIIPSVLASGTSPLPATITSLILIPLFVSPNTLYLYISWTPPPPIRVFNFDSYTIIDPSGNSIPDVSNTLTTYPLSDYIVGLNTCSILTVNKYGSSSSQPFSATITGTVSLTWTERSGLTNAVSITSSSDGTKLAGAVTGGSIYTSTNSGANWTERTGAGTRGWACITSSSDGTKLAASVGGASSGLIYTSTDSGATWTERDNGDRFGGFIKDWRTIASSSDGTKLAAGAYGEYIYTSTDSGATWTEQTNSGSRSWTSIASSSNGTNLFAVASSSIIYRSTDGGTSWSSVNLASGGFPSFTPFFKSITCSSDGTKVVTAATMTGSRDNVFTSTNSGASWTERTSSGSRNWISIASSSDGTKLAAAVSGGYVYTSTDSGSSWTEETGSGSRNWTSIASASDGGILAASVSSASTRVRVEGAPTAPVAFFPNSIGGRVIQTDAYNLPEADGSPLTGWPNTGTGGTVNCSGTVNTNVLNGERVVTFSAATGSWTPASQVNLTAYSMFFVTRQTGSTNGTIFKNSDFSSPQSFGYSSGQKKILNINMSPFSNGSAVTSDTLWDIVSHTRTQNGPYVFNWNGSLLYSGASSTNTPLQNLIISGPSQASDCQVAEVILYNSVLTSTQVSKIEGYLAWKWGLVGNLSSSHPYKNLYPTV